MGPEPFRVNTKLAYQNTHFSRKSRFASTFLVWCALTLIVAAFTGVLVQAEAQEDDPGKVLGEVSAYAGRCGYRSDDEWLQSRFGQLKGFKEARKDTRLSMAGWDIVQLPCGRVRQAIQELRSNVEGKSAPKISTDYEICNFAVTMKDGTASWESGEAWLGYVNEAKRRDLTPEQCAELLGR